MRSVVVAALMAASVLILQGCSKTENAPKPAAGNSINNPSGLTLHSIGDSGIFQLISNNGNTAEITNNSTAVGGTADVNTYSGSPFQKWKITQVTANYFTIVNVGSGLCAQSYNYNGTQVAIQNKFNNTDAQLWSISLLSNKTFKAINKADGLALTANGNAMIQLKPYSGLPTQTWAANILPAGDTVKAKTFSVTNVLQSNMVVQRDKPFVVWGKATTGTMVSVKVSWNSAVFTIPADVSGNWIVSIPATPANTTPQTLIASVSGQKADTLKNLLIGDVWICSGQSNMVMPLDSVAPFYGFEGVVNYKAEIAAANYPLIRAQTVGYALIPKVSETTSKQPWIVCSPTKQSAGTISAVSYYFARKLNTSLNVPIGLVISAASGTYCEEWVSKETLQNDPKLAAYNNLAKNSATQLYNGMIYPLKNLSIKGFIWYQGENNRDDSPISNYTNLNSALITSWRTLFNQGQLPFYFVQMTPFARNFFNTNPWGDDPTADDYAFFREAQSNIRAVPGTGMSVTLDAGELIMIHPRIKKPVGERLALLALHNDYKQNIPCIGPQYASFTQSGSVATVSFKDGTATGLSLSNSNPLGQYFFVAGTDHKFRQGVAVISGNQIVVTAPAGTPLPIQAVRYAFTNFPMDCNVQNSGGLPMEPFRSDNWTN